MNSQPPASAERQVLSVSQLNQNVRRLLETQLGSLWVEGELSNLARPGSGHWYFTLKDASAQIRCAMFRQHNSRLRFVPEPGEKILVKGKVSLYEGRGDYQLIVEQLEPAGLGALQRAFEALKKQLAAEGLFDASHKQPLPSIPKCIGVITSPSGAAIHDILTVLNKRFPAIPVKLYPAAVQGAAAIDELVNAIATANRHQACDVLIVGRGGGSLEDLWCFNEEAVARALFASRIPVVSAVGHEVDFTIADWVADARAATPSAAAEMLSPDQQEMHDNFGAWRELLQRIWLQRWQQWSLQVDNLHKRLKHPGRQLQEQQAQLLKYRQTLARAMARRLAQSQTDTAHLQHRLARLHPGRAMDQQRSAVAHLHKRLITAQQQQLRQQQQQLATTARALETLSPLGALQRGYALVSKGKRLLRKASQAKPGDHVSAQLAEGTLHCRVEAVEGIQ